MRRVAVVAGIVTICVLATDTFAANASGAQPRGKEDYLTYCAPCHGATGNGDGPLAAMLAPRPAQHSDAAFMDGLSDDYLFRFVKEGGPAFGKSALMGAWGRTLPDERIRDVVWFMRLLAARGKG